MIRRITAKNAFAAAIGIAACLAGCATRDRALWHIDEKRGRILFFDASARKWKVLNGSTAKFFVTQDNDLTMYMNGHLVVAPEKIAEAKMSPDARRKDPEGEWGEPHDGFQLGLRVEKSSFATGEGILVTLIMRNVSDSDRYFWSASSGALLNDIELTVTDVNQQTLPRKDKVTGNTFADRLKRIVNNGKYLHIAAGMQRKEVVDLGSVFDFRPGTYKILASRSFETPEGRHGQRVFSGVGTIIISGSR